MLEQWRSSLRSFLIRYEEVKEKTTFFGLKLFVFFACLNFGCYWWALLTTYPHHLQTHKATEYQLMGFPVAIMGASFDFVSLFFTLWLIRRALKTQHSVLYFAYLSVDLVIALVATFWVLFAFVASGWVVNLILDNPETFNQRTELYEGRVWSALLNPFAAENIKNVYFGVLMGASALLPTLVHFYMATLASIKWGARLCRGVLMSRGT